MKRIILISILITGLTAVYGYAQMGQGHMMGQGMMGSQSQQQSGAEYGGGYYPCQQMMGGYGMGPGMMGPGMMGHMGGYGMMGPGMMGGMMGPGMMGRMGGYGMMGPGMMRGMMGPGMMGYGYSGKGYSQEEYQKYQDEYNKYLDKTSGLRKKLHDLMFEYKETIRNPNAERKQIMKLEKEMRDLQWEIYEKAPQ